MFVPVVISLLLTLGVYSFGLNGGYLFDDWVNLIENEQLHATDLNYDQLMVATLSSNAGPLQRPVSMFSFALNHLATGLDPYYFKLTNIFIHLLNGLSLFILSRLLLLAHQERYKTFFSYQQIQLTSWLVCTLWLLHPFNLTSVLYIVQRMTSLSALFTIWGLIAYLCGRKQLCQNQSSLSGIVCILSGLLLFGALAALSKESGLLLVAFMLICEWIFFGFKAKTNRGRQFVLGLNLLTVVLPVMAILFYYGFNIDSLIGSYGYRHFTLSERLLTESRVLWFYLWMICLPSIGQMGIYHDDIGISTSWLEPLTTLPSIIGLMALLIFAITQRKRTPVLSFGLLFFLAGHSMESTFFPLEITHEHRNYLPSFGLVFAAGYYLFHPRLVKHLPELGVPFLVGSVVALLTVSTSIRANNWSNNLELALVNVRYHPNSIRSNIFAGDMSYQFAEYVHSTRNSANYTNEYYDQARTYFTRAAELGSDNLSSRFALLRLDDRVGKPVNPQLLQGLVGALKNGRLHASTINALIRIAQCKYKGSCTLPSLVVNRLFAAVLDNPRLSGKVRAQILTEVAQLVAAQGNMEAALYFTKEATQNWQQPQIYLNYASQLIHNENFEAAHTQIQQARKLDNNHFFERRIQLQEKELLAQTIGLR